MKALVFEAIEQIGFTTIPDPSLETPTDAIIAVKRSAICGSDLHIYHGRECGLDAGTVMGHEFMGEVVAVGAQVQRINIGDRVVSPFTTNCGNCYYCNIGMTCRCTRGQLYGWVEGGHGLHGAQAELVRVPMADATLFPLPDAVSDDLGLMLGDIFSTGFYAADQAQLTPESIVAVIGCGPIGLMAILGARELGAKRIFAVDQVPERLKLAAQFGAETIDFSTTNPKDVVAQATDGRGADAVLEAVGSIPASRTAMDLLRPGGVMSIAGVHTSANFAFTPVEAYDKNLTLKVGRCPARFYMERLAQVIERGVYPLDALITHRLPLAQGVDAYKMFAARRDGCIKVMFES